MIKLPNECLFIVFNNLNDDSKSLYSSLLVNRQLCRIIIPILWSNMTRKLDRKKIINICLLTLNAEEQALLFPFKITLPNYPKPLFEYTSYATSIDSSLNRGVVNWLNKNGHEEILDRWDSNFNYIVNAVKYSLITMFLRTNKRLEYLEIVGFIDSNNKLIFENLCRNNSIISLYLYNNRVDSEGIAEIFEKNTTLTSLNIKSKIFDLNGVKVLANALHINTTLASLKLNYENIDIEGGKALTKVICKNITLTSLNLSNNYISIEGGKAFAEALCANTTLTFLDLSRNYICTEGGKELAKALHENTSLTSLYFSDNNIDIEGGKAFAKALYINTTLTSLDISYNNINFEGGKVLAEVLCKNNILTSLNVRGNNIGNEGAKIFAKVLYINTALTFLDLSHNGITSEGVDALTEALHKNITLVSLYLYGNQIDYNDVIRVHYY